LATIDFERSQRAAKSIKGDSALGYHLSFYSTFSYISFPSPAEQLDSDACVH
jgi:hypothetical protein